MRKLAVVVAVLVLAALGCGGGTAWYLIAGQSNALGRSAQATPSTAGWAHRASAWDPASWGSHPVIEDPWLSDPTEMTIPRGSPWPAMAEARPGAESLLQTARGANCLVDWSAYLPPEAVDSSNGAWGPGGSAYTNALAAWNHHGQPPLRAFLFHQGECDAGVSWALTVQAGAGNSLDHYALVYPLYKAALLDLADRVAADFGTIVVAAPVSTLRCRWEDETGAPGWPDVGCSVLRPHSAKFAPVHNAIIDAAAEHPNLYLGPVVDDVRSSEGDPIHVYDVNELGRRWAAVLQGLPGP